MIVADSSVIVAIMRHEDDATLWTDILDRAPWTIMSVLSYLETSMVMAGRRLNADPERVNQTLKALHITVVPVTLNEGNVAVEAFMQFGKGRHQAALNLA